MKVAVILTARPSWAKLEPVCRALKQYPDVGLQIIACASALLERYGKVVDVVKAQGYEVAAEVYSTYEGANLVTSVKETSALAGALADVVSTLRPCLGVVVADRHEVLGAAQALSYAHIPLLHMQGGEVSGSIDDKVRDAITHLADYHCVCTEHAKFRVYGLTGAYDRVWNTGCPSIDLARQSLSDPPVGVHELGGAGAPIDLAEPFAVVLQHPVTSEADQSAHQMEQTLDGVALARLPAIVFWPGEDAGAEAMSKVIRLQQDRWHTVRSLPPRRFLKLLQQACVLVGNSSVGIRESAFLGVPVVNIGTRQQGRQRGPNVRDVPHDLILIRRAVLDQAQHGRYARSSLYGVGTAGPETARIIRSLVTSPVTA